MHFLFVSHWAMSSLAGGNNHLCFPACVGWFICANISDLVRLSQTIAFSSRPTTKVHLWPWRARKRDVVLKSQACHAKQCKAQLRCYTKLRMTSFFEGQKSTFGSMEQFSCRLIYDKTKMEDCRWFSSWFSNCWISSICLWNWNSEF